MLPLMNLVKWRATSGRIQSCSMLVDFTQIHVRNVILFCFGLGMAKQLFGDNIHCQLSKQNIDQVIVDTKCFINGTRTTFMGETFYHVYYQWIPVILLLLAFSFHLPCRIWHKWLGNYIDEITTKIVDQNSCDKVLDVVTQSKGNGLFWKTWTLENLYALHLICQVWILNVCFQRVWSLSDWSPSAIAVLFPDFADCSHYYWSGGGETWAVFTCLLPLNSAYRKLFWVVYLTFIVLMVLHVLCFGYRLLLLYVYGLKRIDMWWCMKIASSRAQTWYAKTKLMEMWQSMDRAPSASINSLNTKVNDSTYVSMSSLNKRIDESMYESINSLDKKGNDLTYESMSFPKDYCKYDPDEMPATEGTVETLAELHNPPNPVQALTAPLEEDCRPLPYPERRTHDTLV